MSTVLLGSNVFRDCQNIIAVDDHPLLRVLTAPLRVTVTTPAKAGVQLEVVDNDVRVGTGLRLARGDHHVSLDLQNTPILIATLVPDPGDPATVLLKIDFRPCGLDIYDDAAGLHIGTNLFSGNVLVNCTTAVGISE